MDFDRAAQSGGFATAHCGKASPFRGLTAMCCGKAANLGNAGLRGQAQRSWCATQLHREIGRATNLHKLLAITLKLRMLRQRCADFAKDAGRVFIGRLGQAIVHPFTFAPRRDDAGPSQVSQVPRDLWLADFENCHEEADANF